MPRFLATLLALTTAAATSADIQRFYFAFGDNCG